MQSVEVQSEMETRVSEILFYVWDPIGVNGMTSCRDEYEHYVPIISAYLLNNFSEAGVDDLMMFIMDECIGVGLTNVPRRKYQHLQTIRMLMEWKKKICFPSIRMRNQLPQNFQKMRAFWNR